MTGSVVLFQEKSSNYIGRLETDIVTKSEKNVAHTLKNVVHTGQRSSVN